MGCLPKVLAPRSPRITKDSQCSRTRKCSSEKRSNLLSALRRSQATDSLLSHVNILVHLSKWHASVCASDPRTHAAASSVAPQGVYTATPSSLARHAHRSFWPKLRRVSECASEAVAAFLTFPNHHGLISLPPASLSSFCIC